MARNNRIKAEGEAYYHVIARVANGAYLLRDAKRKRRLLDILYRAAEFSGVDVCTYAVMDNHLHLCVRVPDRKEPGDGEVLRRFGALYGDRRMESLERRLSELRKEGRFVDAAWELDRLKRRMGDLSEFMKTFKQRVSQWFNGKLGHEGTLWAGRFKSVLVEEGAYLRVMVHYIHHNPVRAEMVRRASDYEWSALGAAARGDARALKGLSLLGIVPGAAENGPSIRDRRLSNGVVVGSRRFVMQMGGWFAGAVRSPERRVLAFRHGGTDLFATHGQRSAPPRAA